MLWARQRAQQPHVPFPGGAAATAHVPPSPHLTRAGHQGQASHTSMTAAAGHGSPLEDRSSAQQGNNPQPNFLVLSSRNPIRLRHALLANCGCCCSTLLTLPVLAAWLVEVDVHIDDARGDHRLTEVEHVGHVDGGVVADLHDLVALDVHCTAGGHVGGGGRGALDRASTEPGFSLVQERSRGGHIRHCADSAHGMGSVVGSWQCCACNLWVILGPASVEGPRRLQQVS